MSELKIVAGDVQLLLVAPNGKRTGYDPRARKQFRTIAESSYFEDALPVYDTGAVDMSTTQTIDVKHPETGKYRLVVSRGTANEGEEYEIRVTFYRPDGSEAGSGRIAGTVKPAGATVYDLRVNIRSGNARVAITKAR